MDQSAFRYVTVTSVVSSADFCVAWEISVKHRGEVLALSSLKRLKSQRKRASERESVCMKELHITREIKRDR